MEQEKTKQETNEEQTKIGTTEDSGEGDKSELVKQTEAAHAAAERMEKAKEELNAAEARKRLGGTTEAGNVKEEKKVDPKEKAKEYAKSIMTGKIPE